MLPKLYVIAHPRCPYRVVFTGPAGKRVLRHFKIKAEAVAYHRELLAKAKVAGTAGLVLDAEMRAEYFAARRALDGDSIMTAVRYYLSHRPAGIGAAPLSEARDAFLLDKKRSGRAERTIKTLKSVIDAFLAFSPAKVVADYTRDALTQYLDSLDAPPLTIRNHRARLATFGDWLARRQYIPENPARYIDVAHHDPRPPRVLTPLEAEKVMARAVGYRDGLFVGMYSIALYAGLRWGEILRLTWDDVFLDGSPIIRVGRGKIRGRRAIRVVSVEPALLSWLKQVKASGRPLINASSDSRKVRAVVKWQTDIARHSWISYRLAMISDEAKVAREAGNSPDVIYRHYFQLVSRRDALRYFSNWSSGLSDRQSG